MLILLLEINDEKMTEDEEKLQCAENGKFFRADVILYIVTY